MDTSAKPKEKSVSFQLVWTTDYEVISPYTVDECVRQLDALREKYRFKRPPFFNLSGFEFDPVTDNGGIVHFGVLAKTGKLGINGKAVGQLIYQSQNNTLVKVRIGLTKGSVIFYLSMMVIIHLIVVLGIDIRTAVWGLLLYDTIFFVIQISNCSALKPELYKTLCETLAVPQASRPQTLPP